jgi:flagellar hook-associated protein 2
VTVSPDTTQATAAVNNFVSAYNALVQAINTQFTNTQGAAPPPLFSDSTLQQVQETLNGDVNYALGGTNLASFGVNLQQDGTLKVDSGTLTSALSNNFGSVQTFFQQTTGGNGFAVQFGNDLANLTNTTTGPLYIEAQSIQQSETSLQNDINDFQANIAQEQQTLTQQFSQVNAVLQQLPLTIEQIDNQLGISGGASA